MTVTSTTAASVIVAIPGCCTKLFFAAGARFSPISATIVPETMGGSKASTHPLPRHVTSAPTMASNSPVTAIPNNALPVPPSTLAAVTGAMNANDEPR